MKNGVILTMTNERNEAEQPEYIYIPDEEGKEEEFEVLMRFEVDHSERQYMMVIPTAQSDDEAEEEEVYAFRYEEDGDDIKLFTIEDDAEWDIVEETFNTLMSEWDDEED